MKKFLKWLKRNIGVGFWLLIAIIGMLLACYGFAQVLVLERLEIIDIAKIAGTFVAGFVFFILGLSFMQKKLLASKVTYERTEKKNIDVNDKGPNIVVIGGGVGLARVLRGLKNYTNNLTAIVTVSSYGNDNKRKPTDDMRNSLIALAKNEEEMQRLLNCEMGNTSFGDIYLSVMEKANKDLAVGIEKSNDILMITGRVLPVTLDEMKICVELEDGTVIEDREKIAEITSGKATKINRVYINPTNCRVAPKVLEAIQQADAIVLGPGELYTSVIPNLLIRNVAKTIRESKAFKIYISNIMTEPGHTDDYALSDHINAIIEHAGKDIINYCICDNGDIVPEIIRKYIKDGSNLVDLDKQNTKGIKIIRADVSCVEGEYIRHDSDLIARAIIDLIVNELKFKDKQKNEQFVMLNQKLKETKKKVKERKKQRIKKKKPRYKLKSKFSNKYKDRIMSIKESDEITEQNRKKYEKNNAKKAEKRTTKETKKAPKKEKNKEEQKKENVKKEEPKKETTKKETVKKEKETQKENKKTQKQSKLAKPAEKKPVSKHSKGMKTIGRRTNTKEKQKK